MAKQNKSYKDDSTFELFDEVELNPDMFPSRDISDKEPYCVIKKYVVEFGEHKVPYVDICKQEKPGEASLRGIEVTRDGRNRSSSHSRTKAFNIQKRNETHRYRPHCNSYHRGDYPEWYWRHSAYYRRA